MNLNAYIVTVKSYITDHKKQIVTGAKVAAGSTGLLALVALFIYGVTPHYVYEPVKACDLLTPADALELLGDKAIGVNTKQPVVSNDTSISGCSYTDSNTKKMLVAAIKVRSGVNDRGVQQNRKDFATARLNNKDTITNVKDLGEQAYFNPVVGQLNVLDGRKWIILSFGVGSDPQSNTIDDAVKLAHKVLG